MGYLLANVFVGILCSIVLLQNTDLYVRYSNEMLIQTDVSFSCCVEISLC